MNTPIAFTQEIPKVCILSFMEKATKGKDSVTLYKSNDGWNDEIPKINWVLIKLGNNFVFKQRSVK